MGRLFDIFANIKKASCNSGKAGVLMLTVLLCLSSISLATKAQAASDANIVAKEQAETKKVKETTPVDTKLLEDVSKILESTSTVEAEAKYRSDSAMLYGDAARKELRFKEYYADKYGDDWQDKLEGGDAVVWQQVQKEKTSASRGLSTYLLLQNQKKLNDLKTKTAGRQMSESENKEYIKLFSDFQESYRSWAPGASEAEKSWLKIKQDSDALKLKVAKSGNFEEDMKKKYGDDWENKLSENEKKVQNTYNNELVGEAKKFEAYKVEYDKLISENNCPTIDQLRQKWQGGCYTCLVIEKMVSTFMAAASKAYEISQKAGVTVLGIGAVLWLLLWGLKNLSSMTAIMGGNILNDLLKTAFKILLAYVFITAGIKVVIGYFVAPVIGTGSVIAEQFWSRIDRGQGSLEDATEDYNWEDFTDLGGLTKIEAEQELKKKEKLVQEFKLGEAKQESLAAPMPSTGVNTMTPEQIEERKNALKKAAEEVKLGGVPKFITYPTNGTVTSPFGKRDFSGCKLHAGVDIGAPKGTPIVAAYEGTISRVGSENANNIWQGYGLRVYIKHPGGWETIYAHMSEQLVKLGDVVKKGDIIGKTGNTGKNAAFHLHFEIHTPQGRPVDPVGIADGVVNEVDYYGTRSQCGNKFGIAGDKWKVGAVSPGITPIPLKGDYSYGANSTGGGSGSSGGPALYNAAMDYSAFVLPTLGEIKYNGPTDILPQSLMNSILGATKVITDNTAESMVLGNAITCFSSKPAGGAWKLKEGWFSSIHITNFIMWLEGGVIWACGFMLTLAVGYYLLDICFKIAFAVIAMPIVIGLWPFNLTKGKFTACMSIVFKAAATFAFLAITTNYAMELINASFGDLSKLYDALSIVPGSTDPNQANLTYVENTLAVFGSFFILVLFSFIYSFKLIGSTLSSIVDKFFSDSVFKGESPMHKWSTAMTKYAKDKVMAPVGFIRDTALHQTGKLVNKTVGGTFDTITGKGKGNNAVGNTTKVAGKTTKVAGQITKGVGKGTQKAGQALSKIPYVGAALGGLVSGIGKGVEATGEAAQKIGKAVDKAGDQINKVGRWNNKPKDDKKK